MKQGRVKPRPGIEAHPENNGDLPKITKKGIYIDRIFSDLDLDSHRFTFLEKLKSFLL